MVAVLGAAVGSLLLFPVPPLGFYLSLGAVLLWRWLKARAAPAALRSVTRVVVWAAFATNVVWLLLAVGICGPRILILVCDA